MQKIRLVLNEFISLIFDIATLRRTILGVNAQYWYFNLDKIQVKSLCFKEIKGQSTAFNLKRIISATLLEYEIEISQVINIITDNGSNMIKTASIMNERAAQESIHSKIVCDDSEDFDINIMELAI